MTRPAEVGTLLNAALARRQRLSLGLSERDVAKRLGVSGQVISNLERGLNHDELTAALVCALASLLALPVTGLFTDDPTPGARQAGRSDDAAPPDSDDDGPSPADAAGAGDVRQLGALLAREGVLLPVTTLAAVLGWPLERVQAGLSALEPALTAAGQRLHRLGGDVKVVADATELPTDTVETLTRRSFARRGMSLAQARMLHRAWQGTLTGTEHGNAERVTLADLVNGGVIRFDAGTARGQQPGPSDDAHFSLGPFGRPSLGPSGAS